MLWHDICIALRLLRYFGDISSSKHMRLFNKRRNFQLRWTFSVKIWTVFLSFQNTKSHLHWLKYWPSEVINNCWKILVHSPFMLTEINLDQFKKNPEIIFVILNWIKRSTKTISRYLYCCFKAGYTVKKGKRLAIFLSLAGMSLTVSSPWPGIIQLFLVRKSLVSEIPAGDGNVANLFLLC